MLLPVLPPIPVFDVLMGGGPVGGRFLGSERLGRRGDGAGLFEDDEGGGEVIFKRDISPGSVCRYECEYCSSHDFNGYRRMKYISISRLL